MTKAYHSFQSKIIYFSDDLELVDFLRSTVLDGTLSDQSSEYVFKDLNPQKYVKLSRRKNCDGSRNLLLSHLRKSVYGSYVKDVYEEVTAYFKNIIYAFFKCDINSPRVIGEHSIKIDARDLLSLGSWDSVCRFVANSVFQSIESERSTIELLNKIKKKIGINIEQDIIDNAIPYLQVRHFLVHADGILSEDFIKKYPSIRHNKSRDILLNNQFLLNFNKQITTLIRSYDEKIVEQNLLHEELLMPYNY